MDSDSALRLLGRYSKWQVRRYLAYAIGFGIPYAWMQLSVVFIGEYLSCKENQNPNSVLKVFLPNLIYSECSRVKDALSCRDMVVIKSILQ